MCFGVLAVLPEMSTCCDKTMPVGWPSQAWKCGALPCIRQEARNMPGQQQLLMRLPGRYHLVQGG